MTCGLGRRKNKAHIRFILLTTCWCNVEGKQQAALTGTQIWSGKYRYSGGEPSRVWKQLLFLEGIYDHYSSILFSPKTIKRFL
jgi:hypothetical protein